MVTQMKCHFLNQSPFSKLDTNQSQVLEYDQVTLRLCSRPRQFGSGACETLFKPPHNAPERKLTVRMFVILLLGY